MSQKKGKNFEIIFKKLDEIKSNDYNDIIVFSKEVSEELKENSDILEELESLAKAKKEAEHNGFYTGT